MASRQKYRRLRRSRDNKVIAGVCGGIGEYFGIDPVIFRIAFAVALFVWGTGVGVYVLLWVVMPEAPRIVPYLDDDDDEPVYHESKHQEDKHNDDDWSDF